MGTPQLRVSAGTLHRQIESILLAWGMPAELVTPTADVMTETDLRGIDSHGVAMLPLYGLMRRGGKINMQPRIRTVRESAVTALIDADGGLGHAPSMQAMDLAIDKAHAAGLAAVAVRNSNHFGAAGAYALHAARAGLIGMVMTNAGGRAIVPTRAQEPVFGTNPIAFAAPAGRNEPFVLDMATSTVAVGKVKLAVYNHRELPEGWAVDGTGETVTDPNRAFDGHGRLVPDFGLTPLGGLPRLSSHKGYGLAAMVEILCSMLPGASYIGALADAQQHETGHFFLAMQPDAFREPGRFAAELDAMLDHLRGLPPADPALPVLVAGDPERAAEATRAQSGISIPDILVRGVRELCEEAGVAFLLDGEGGGDGRDDG